MYSIKCHSDIIDHRVSVLKLCDAGDVSSQGTLEQTHVELEKSVYKILKTGAVPFVIGGGNDQSYPNCSALMKSVLEGIGNQKFLHA